MWRYTNLQPFDGPDSRPFAYNFCSKTTLAYRLPVQRLAETQGVSGDARLLSARNKGKMS
jgi:hypothetical protein